jgi:triosephosphate isomerase
MTMLIAGNWKMFKPPSEADPFCERLAGELAGLEGVDVVVCPPYPSIPVSVRALEGSPIEVYAQNVHWADDGAFTGEVSARMLIEIGAAGTIVAHSERRQLFGETDESAAMRVDAALERGLRVIACVGETEAERDEGETERVVRRQLAAIARLLEAAERERLAIAYEPVWAIGTGKTATPEQAEEMHAIVRSVLDVPILYGGSVKPENAAELLSQPNVDGALVGGASLDVDSFAAICRIAQSQS